MSECAAQNPARLSLTTFSAALISFFILPSPFAIASASGILDQPCDFLRELAQQRVKLVVLLFGPQIRQHQRETPAAFALFQEKQPAGVRPVIGFKEPVPLLCREMADLDDGVHVLRRDRRLIGRVGNLRDETAILAERFGQTLAHAGWASIEHIPKRSEEHTSELQSQSNLVCRLLLEKKKKKKTKNHTNRKKKKKNQTTK